ncbi:MAG: TrkH family potassium uptake protein [Clostridiales bacterium]|jgi:trk system potassium uptake protein TrkH|nr:TrkH family potassium uptake protein [Clostridiales bacterium]
MNFSIVFKLLGNVLKYEAVLMVLSLIVSLIYREQQAAGFVVTIALLLAAGILLSLIKPKENTFRLKEGFAAVALAWFALAAFGALPFFLSGYFSNYIDCFFEAVSGFTTTGATILTEVENLPRGILFWRSFTHWIGGMGVLVFMLALIPMGASSVNLLKAESPGPNPGKFVPKLKETAKITYMIYFVMTIVQIILLVIAGLPLFDATIHALGSAGTGGFSNMNLSMGAYNNVAAEVITTVFMFLFGINFTLYFYLLRKDIKSFFKDEEFRLYLGIVLGAITLITVNITGMYGGSVLEALRHASFQVSTIITTTGYSTTNFDLWPSFSKMILVLLMLVGACAGSTGGGIKVVRVLTMFKTIGTEISRLVHPRIFKPVRLNGKKVEEDILSRIFMFLFVYGAFFIIATLLVSVENKDMVSNATAVVSALSNVGPGLAVVGPMGNFSSYSDFSTIVFSLCMIAGRLEFFPVLVLFAPSIWRKGAAT